MYTTTANIAAKLGRSLTTEETNYFTNVLGPSIDAVINNLTDTQFDNDTAGSIYVDAEDDSSYLVIPTMHEITAVTYIHPDGTEEAVSVDDYYTYPRGSTVEKYAIRRIGGSWNFDEDGTYKVTGKLGYAEVPADIVGLATEIAVAGVTNNPNGYKSERVGDWAVTYADGVQGLPADAENVLARYRRLSRSL